MKAIFFIILNLFLVNLTFAQIVLPPPPPREFDDAESLIQKYQIKLEVKKDSIIHSNKFFTLRCKNFGQAMNYINSTWMLTAKEFSNMIKPEIVIYGIQKDFFETKKEEIKYFGFNEPADLNNIEKIGDYFFVYNPLKTHTKFNRNLENYTLQSKSKTNFDGVNFMKYDFQITVKENNFIETKYLALLGGVIFIIQERRNQNEIDTIMNGFKKVK